MRRPPKYMHPQEALVVLGLDKEQDLDTNKVKVAYRKLAMKHHPDKGGDAEMFKRIAAAYESLCHDIERAKNFVRGPEEKGGEYVNVAGIHVRVVNWSEIFSSGTFRSSYTTWRRSDTATNNTTG